MTKDEYDYWYCYHKWMKYEEDKLNKYGDWVKFDKPIDLIFYSVGCFNVTKP